MLTRFKEKELFLKAAENGDDVRIRDMLNRGLNVNMEFHGKAILHVAASNGHEILVDFLCRSGADINKKLDDCSTPLHSAVIGGNKNIVRKLIELGADVNSEYKKNVTPLHLAVEYKYVNIVKCLLNNGAEVNCATKSYGDTPLILAMQKASCIIDDDSSSKEKFTDFVRITNMLLKKGASVNAQNFSGNKPLHYAAQIYHFRPDIIRLLLDYGADVNALNKMDATPIYYTRNEIILEMLIHRGANVNYLSKKLFTPLSNMIKSDQSSCVEVLLRNGADVNIQNFKGQNLLDFYWPWYNHENDEILLESIMSQTAYVNRAIHRLGKLDEDKKFIDFLCAIIVKRKVSNKITFDVESLKSDNPNSRYQYFCSRIPTCEMEIVRMKNTKINIGKLSVFDILDMPINKLLNYVKRKELLTLESDNVNEDFPFYAAMLKSHIKQAKKRRVLVDASAEALKKLIFHCHKIKLPEVVVYTIVPMLSNGYLTTLAQV